MALRPKAEEERKLQTAIEGRRHLFTFMTNRKLSPTNDGSEQALYVSPFSASFDGSPAKSWRRSPSPNPRAMIAGLAAQGRMAWTIDSLTRNVSNYAQGVATPNRQSTLHTRSANIIFPSRLNVQP
jgi:hypothetical protein